MDISEIKSLLQSENPQDRLRSLVALKDHGPTDAVPILINQRQDSAFLVRSFVAMGLGRKRNDAAYNALIEMLSAESDQNVQAEIANSLGLYGARAVNTLVKLFYDNENWLVRRSILAIMPEMDAPEKLLEIGIFSMRSTDQTIVQAGISTMALLADTEQSDAALRSLMPILDDSNWRSRMYLAYALKPFEQPSAKEALTQLRQDSHHKVIAAALEDLLPA